MHIFPKLMDNEQKFTDLEIKFTRLISDLRCLIEENMQREHVHLVDMRNDITHVASQVGIMRNKARKCLKQTKNSDGKLPSNQGKHGTCTKRTSPLRRSNNFFRLERRSTLNKNRYNLAGAEYERSRSKPKRTIKNGLSFAAGSVLDFAIDCFTH